jgi:hypothetical protein
MDIVERSGLVVNVQLSHKKGLRRHFVDRRRSVGNQSLAFDDLSRLVLRFVLLCGDQSRRFGRSLDDSNLKVLGSRLRVVTLELLGVAYAATRRSSDT